MVCKTMTVDRFGQMKVGSDSDHRERQHRLVGSGRLNQYKAELLLLGMQDALFRDHKTNIVAWMLRRSWTEMRCESADLSGSPIK